MKLLPSILIVDDDASWIKRIEADVPARYTIGLSLDEGMSLIEEHDEFDAAIFDLILPIRDDNGKMMDILPDAGCVLAVAFLSKFPATKVAICSSSDGAMNILAERNASTPNISFFNKKDPNYADQLMKFLELITPLPKIEKPMLKKIWDSIIFQPKIGGIGLDFKVLVEKFGKDRN